MNGFRINSLVTKACDPTPNNVLWNRVNIALGKFCFFSLSLNWDEQDLPSVRQWVGVRDLRSEKNAGDRWNHYATKKTHVSDLFWVLQDFPVWQWEAWWNKYKINVEMVNGDNLLKFM